MKIFNVISVSYDADDKQPTLELVYPYSSLENARKKFYALVRESEPDISDNDLKLLSKDRKYIYQDEDCVLFIDSKTIDQY
ncbi:MAG: hypothetical protein AABY32_01415 [Nanoarchaeota archaeon]